MDIFNIEGGGSLYGWSEWQVELRQHFVDRNSNGLYTFATSSVSLSVSHFSSTALSYILIGTEHLIKSTIFQSIVLKKATYRGVIQFCLNVIAYSQGRWEVANWSVALVLYELVCQWRLDGLLLWVSPFHVANINSLQPCVRRHLVAHQSTASHV